MSHSENTTRFTMEGIPDVPISRSPTLVATEIGSDTETDSVSSDEMDEALKEYYASYLEKWLDAILIHWAERKGELLRPEPEERFRIAARAAMAHIEAPELPWCAYNLGLMDIALGKVTREEYSKFADLYLAFWAWCDRWLHWNLVLEEQTEEVDGGQLKRRMTH